MKVLNLMINSPVAQDTPSSLVGAQLVVVGTLRSGSGTRRPCCVSVALRPLVTGTGNQQVPPGVVPDGAPDVPDVAADRETGLGSRSRCEVSPLYWNWNPLWNCGPFLLKEAKKRR